LQRRYSSKLVKKLKWLIYDAENYVSEDETNLTENLLQLDEQMNRVMDKVKKVHEKGSRSYNETTACSPEKSLKIKVKSFRTSPNI